MLLMQIPNQSSSKVFTVRTSIESAAKSKREQPQWCLISNGHADLWKLTLRHCNIYNNTNITTVEMLVLLHDEIEINSKHDVGTT